MTRPETLKLWTERLQRFEKAHATVAQFCKAEGISQPLFYKWKRKLTSPPDKVTSAIAKFVPVALQAEPDQLDTPLSRTTMTIELPGEICVRFEMPAQTQQADSSGPRS